MFVIFDLDGTLADCEHRQHHIRAFDGASAAAVDWDAFYRACVHDKPIRHAINIMAALRNAGASVEIWTGRSDIVLGETIDWLARHGAPRVGLRMRPHGDHQPDDRLKRFWLRHAAVRPDLVFEDRARVVAMWRAEGIPCYQVAEGDF